MKKLVVRHEGNGRYLVIGGPIRRDVVARDKRDALRKVKSELSGTERYLYRTSPTRRERAVTGRRTDQP